MARRTATPAPPPPTLSVVEPPPPAITARERWSDYGNRRTRAVVDALRQLGKLTTNSYERRAEDIDAIEALLTAELEDCLRELRRGLGPKQEISKLF